MFRLASQKYGLSLVACLLASSTVLAETNWPRWRGAAGLGHSDEQNLPRKWSAGQETWRCQLPGSGQSSPVIWGDRIYLTAAELVDGQAQRMVLCIDRNTGKIVWNQVAATGPPEEVHKMNGYASPTCAVDGEHVVAFFGDGGLHCYSIDGERQWQLDLGEFPGAWGCGASPSILGDWVIQNCDAEGEAYLLAVEKSTGKQVWRTERRATPKGGWSTPILIDTGARQELVLNGEFGVQGYDPQTGKELWFCQSFNGRGTPTPVWGGGLLYVINGKPGDIYSVRPGGSGDVTKTHMAWHTPRRGGRDLPSPALAGDMLLGVDMQGVGAGYDAATGKQLWKGRIGGNYSASPLVAGGLIYLLSEAGETVLIRPGGQLDIVARNKIGPGDEVFRASPAASDGQLFLRSDRALYCIGERTK
jgi:outer membrane protein assembly factor BamB